MYTPKHLDESTHISLHSLERPRIRNMVIGNTVRAECGPVHNVMPQVLICHTVTFRSPVKNPLLQEFVL